jgi:hypothetical protein
MIIARKRIRNCRFKNEKTLQISDKDLKILREKGIKVVDGRHKKYTNTDAYGRDVVP